MTASTNPSRLELAFDIGHSSIGWAVLSAPDTASPEVLGCGSVIFEKDSALANTRRLHRSQRRHVRATRQRIARMEKLLVHLGIFSADELKLKHRANGGSPTPWLLAARVLASSGAQTLTWPELWDVLRWYAHNRGYEEITGETRDDDEMSDEKKKDTEKVENAKAALTQFGKNSMAETICAWLGQDPLGPRSGTTENYKAKNCAFERAFVDAEVTRLLASHLGKLPKINEALVAALILDARAITVPGIRLPRRYQGSLLFGRLATRYHNRIIGICPISGEKIPNKNCSEFLRYRWAMQLANLRVADSVDTPLRSLTANERATVHARMLTGGSLGVRDLKEIVRSLPGHARDNLEQFFLHPDAKEGLVLDPIQKLITGEARVAAVWPHLPERLQKRVRGRWRHGKSTTLAKLREEAAKLGHDCTAFDAAVDALCAPPKKPSKKTPPPVKEKLLLESLDARRELAKLSGRAPYARPLLAKAFDEVMAGRDPKATGGCLEETDDVRRRRETRPLPQQTNNHLVRHRLQIFGRLLADLTADPTYGAGNTARISRITLEVNRDLREMAGLTAQDIAKELGQRLKQHGDAVKWLEQDPQVAPRISAGLIRKARVALDLGKRCPYTGEELNPIDLVTKRVDLDHIIPRSQRTSDSLDSLALTFSAVNKWKGQRTAYQFIQDEGGKSVPDAPQLSLMTLARFKAHVDALDTKGHLDDYRRKKRRKEFFILERYEEKARTFTPGQLTQTSQLARLGAQTVRQVLPHLEPHDLVALPGSVTGTVRKSWDVLGCLSGAAPGVLETVKLPDGTERTDVRTKTEIRDITHLHHALDACVLALAAHFIPNRGDVWRLLAERRLDSAQQAQLAALGLFDFDARGQFRLRDLAPELKEQIRQKLVERRVVQHVPADMSGLRVEENTRGIVRRENGRVVLQQRKKNADGKVVVNRTEESEGKLVGLPRADGSGGKLAALKGVRVISDNFGVAILSDVTLPPEERFVVVPYERVWKRVEELKARNGGTRPIILRLGMLVEVPRGRYIGHWMIRGVQLNQRAGLLVDLSFADFITYRKAGRAEAKQNVLLNTLIKDGLRIKRCALTGSELR
jgi:CRISPR-associated endonuclease Csn1